VYSESEMVVKEVLIYFEVFATKLKLSGNTLEFDLEFAHDYF
jgi:hypothetical protein